MTIPVHAQVVLDSLPPETFEAALAFKVRWDKARCKRRGYTDWKDALRCAWHQGWDDREPSGGLLRALRNNYGHYWLNEQPL